MIGARIVRQSPIRSHAPDGGGGRRAETETETGSFLREESGLSLRIGSGCSESQFALFACGSWFKIHTYTDLGTYVGTVEVYSVRYLIRPCTWRSESGIRREAMI